MRQNGKFQVSERCCGNPKKIKRNLKSTVFQTVLCRTICLRSCPCQSRGTLTRPPRYHEGRGAGLDKSWGEGMGLGRGEHAGMGEEPGPEPRGLVRACRRGYERGGLKPDQHRWRAAATQQGGEHGRKKHMGKKREK